jgi:hypothetical protein
MLSPARTLLKPLAWRYHSLMELRVDLRERSNMKRMATASLHTKGSMLTLALSGSTAQSVGAHEFALASQIP